MLYDGNCYQCDVNQLLDAGRNNPVCFEAAQCELRAGLVLAGLGSRVCVCDGARNFVATSEGCFCRAGAMNKVELLNGVETHVCAFDCGEQFYAPLFEICLSDCADLQLVERHPGSRECGCQPGTYMLPHPVQFGDLC